MRWLVDVPAAHRGYHDLRAGRPENTLSAFRAAIDNGYMIECDVGLTSDGVPVVFHDDGLARLTGRTGLLDQTDAATLTRMPVLGSAETVPTFAAMLELVRGRVPLLIELKSGSGRRGRLEPAVMRLLDGYRGPYAIQSFDPWMVAWFRHNAPHVPRGQISMDYRLDDDESAPPRLHGPLTRLGFWRMAAPDFVAYDIHALPNWPTTRLRRQGVPLLTWTVRTAADRARAAAHADNVIFEGWRA